MLYSLTITCPVGFLKISGTEEFVSSITFSDSNSVVNSEIIPSVILECEQQLLSYFSGKKKEFDFPFQQSGTEFQQKVWSNLLDIPYGETISYLELSKRIGDTKSIRAVGTANGKNNLAILVPCHRVIGTNGSLTGYAGGLNRKEWLLRLEGSWPIGNQTELF